MQTTLGSASGATGWRRTLQTNWFFILVLVFLIAFPFLVGALTNSNPLATGRAARGNAAIYWQGVAVELLIFAILAMSYNLIFGFTGIISFGHALFFGLSGYLMGGFARSTEFGALGLPLGILAALTMCVVAGLAIGLVSLRLKGVYFAIFTLAIAEMAFIFFRRYPGTGSEDGFTLGTLPDWIDPTRSRLNFYLLVVAVFVFTFLFIRRLMYSPTGAVFLGIRENDNRARTIGYNTVLFKLLALTLGGVFAGVAGILFTLMNKKVGPEMLTSIYTVDPLLMTIIGGIGTFTGPVIGGVGLKLVEKLLLNAEVTIFGTVLDIGSIWPLVLGVVFILVVIVFPAGVVGTLTRWRTRLQRRAAAARPAESAAD